MKISSSRWGKLEYTITSGDLFITNNQPCQYHIHIAFYVIFSILFDMFIKNRQTEIELQSTK
jgi:hypothetical protein